MQEALSFLGVMKNGAEKVRVRSRPFVNKVKIQRIMFYVVLDRLKKYRDSKSTCPTTS